MNSIEVRLKDCAAQENCDSEEYDLMQEAANEIKQLRVQLAKASEETLKLEQRLKSTEELLISSNDDLAKAINEAGQHKITAEYSSRHLSQCEAALSSEQDKREEVEQQLAKASERVKELEQAIDNELIIHCSVTEGSPEEKVKRLLDVACSWALDPKVSEQANKFAIEKKIEAMNEALDYYEELKVSEEPIGAGSMLHVCLGRLISQKKQLHKGQE